MNPTRFDLTYGGTLMRVGDRMQSAASRVREWAVQWDNEADYETQMALLELANAIDEWTDIRKAAPS